MGGGHVVRTNRGVASGRENGGATRFPFAFPYVITYVSCMHPVSATHARMNLYRLIDCAGDEPVRIAGKRGNAVLVTEADWPAIQEMFCRLSISGRRV